MDFGIGFLSNNVMVPILDFFYGIVPSYGLAIVALTLVVRLGLFPVSANQIRSMRRMKIANPIMQQRIKEVQAKYKDDPAKQQEESAKVNAANFKEFGNPLSGCLPALLQLPILFALFATLRGSPFSDINYAINFQVLAADQQAQVQPQAFVTPPQNIYFADRVHFPVQAVIPSGTNLVVGEKVKIDLQTVQGEEFTALNGKFEGVDLTPKWSVTKGAGQIEVAADGTVTALQPGDVTIQASVPGLATNKGFLFIKALGKVGATNVDGSINWDILIMIIGFGLSLYVNQAISGGQSSPNQENSQQDTMNKVTPIIFSGMFLFFPLPAGVLMYMLIANVFQTAQSFLVSREPLPENLQKLADEMEKNAPKPELATETGASKPAKSEKKAEPMKRAEPPSDDARTNLPFEPGKNTGKKKKS